MLRCLPLLMKNGMETARVGMRESPMAARRAEERERVREVLVSTTVVGMMARESRERTAGRDWELTMADGMSSLTGARVVTSLPDITAPCNVMENVMESFWYRPASGAGV